MARPLRQQFVVATLILLVPLAAVMTWAAGRTYNGEIPQVRRDARALASVIAAHIDASHPDDDANLNAFLQKIELQDAGMSVVVREPDGHVIAEKKGDPNNVEEPVPGSAWATRHPWLVTVTVPSSVAWGRTKDTYRRSVAIAGIATLIMVTVEAFFIRRWLGALRQFEAASDQVGAGDLRTPLHGKMPSLELEHLRDAFNGMVDNLREAREAIARQVVEERRMREELQSLQQQIIRQERLAAIGVLLSGIAHELNNPLQAISGFADLLQRDPEMKPPVRADLAIIKKESMRASAIIRNLSRFSRQQGASPSHVYLRDVVASVIELRQRRFYEQGIRLELEDEASQPVLAVFTELQQVVLNFVINAEQAIAVRPQQERAITIRTLDVETLVRLEVEDSGPGVPAEDEAKLFQPFFTTKPIGEGTGLGLSVSYGIVRTCGGSIGYRRGAAGGACFYFELPASELTPRT